MACSRYALRYGAGGILSATYLNCGDFTPFTIDESGGTSGAEFGVIIATTGSLTMYTGFASAGGEPVPGFVYTQQIAPWSTYVTTSSAGGQSFTPGE